MHMSVMVCLDDKNQLLMLGWELSSVVVQVIDQANPCLRGSLV